MVARTDRPGADGPDEFCPEAAPPVLGMNIDFLEMSDGWLDDFDVRKAHRNIVRERNPEVAVTLRVFRTSSLVVSSRTDSGAWPTRSLAAASSIAGSAARSSGRAAVDRVHSASRYVEGTTGFAAAAISARTSSAMRRSCPALWDSVPRRRWWRGLRRACRGALATRDGRVPVPGTAAVIATTFPSSSPEPITQSMPFFRTPGRLNPYSGVCDKNGVTF